ncbi:MAG: hypothetical protein WBK77_02645, partial [Alphaproteobacteria bacterium]
RLYCWLGLVLCFSVAVRAEALLRMSWLYGPEVGMAVQETVIGIEIAQSTTLVINNDFFFRDMVVIQSRD